MAERSTWQGAVMRGATSAPTPWTTASQRYQMDWANRAMPSVALGQRTPSQGVPRPARAVTDPSTIDPTLLSPQGTGYWTRQGGGHALLMGAALAHVAAGMLGVALGLLGWLVLMPGTLLPEVAGGSSLLAALAGAVAFELARFAQPWIALGARILLVGADLLVASIILWLLGAGSFAPLLFLVPVVIAALLFPKRVTAAIGALSVAEFAVICAAQAGFASLGWLPTPAPLAVWLPLAGALAGVSTLLAYCCTLASLQTAESMTAIFQWVEQLAGQRAALRAEQQRLIEGMRALEDAQARLTQERATINRQVVEIARVVERLGEGDSGVLRALHPGLYGPLAALASALAHLGQRLATLENQQQQSGAQLRTLEAVCGGAREQGQLLALTDGALRELSSSANGLVEAVQRIERGSYGSGELVGREGRVLIQALREIEQQALAQASDTAMLGARLAQLRARQSELESSLRHLMPAPPAQDPSGGLVGERETANGAHSGPQVVPPGPQGLRGGDAPVPAGVTVGQRLEPLRNRGGQQVNWLM